MDYPNLCYGCFADKGIQDPCSRCGYTLNKSKEAALYLKPGKILAGSYLVGKVLGQGGFGITYLGWDLNLSIKLAIKEFFPQGLVSRSPGQSKVLSFTGVKKNQFDLGLDRFLREARTLALFEHHPNIVTVRDFFRENNTAYMVMSHIDGVTLLEHLKNSGNRIPVEKAVQIIMPVLDALKEVHRAGIMHRDISPDNIFIDNKGRVILIDFGAARQEMREKSKSLSVILKAGYAPPEQYQSRGRQGPWTDIYAVAATMYRSITGQAPLDAIDRLTEDDLKPPSKFNVEIDPGREQVLLRALAVKAEDRFQTMEEFQRELVSSPARSWVREDYTGGRAKETTGLDKADIKSSEVVVGQETKVSKQAEAVKETEKKPEPAEKPAGWAPQAVPTYSISKRTVKTATLVALCALLLVGGISLFGSVEEFTGPTGPAANEAYQAVDSDIIVDSDSIYVIDYDSGTITVGDLPIGSLVVDPSWEWEFRTDSFYSGNGEKKPVMWTLVAKNHYSDLEPHVTLLSEELIGKYIFDIRPYWGPKHSDEGRNHWGDSGTAEDTSLQGLNLPPRSSFGLRPWLNSTGVHADEGFYWAFSENFKSAVITTTVLNREWGSGISYSTSDKVFIPSTTELGDTSHSDTYQIGTNYLYFQGADNAKRVARLNGEASWYWTRSPDTTLNDRVRGVDSSGEFSYGGALAYYGYDSVRPVVNLKADTLVSEISK